MAFIFHKQFLKDLLVALSFVNLCFIRVWTSLTSSENYFFQENIPNNADLIALILNILIFSTVFFLVMRLFRRTRSPVLRMIFACFFFVICIIPINFLRINLTQINFALFTSLSKFLKALTILAIFTFTIYTLKFHLNKLLKITYSLLLIFSPLLLLNIVNASIKISRNNAIKPALPGKTQISESQVILPKQKVILMIYDALDYHNLFVSKNKASLPHLTQFKNQSLFANKAISPSDCTLNSISSYLIGKTVMKAKTIDAYKLQVLLKGENEFSYINFSTPNLFQKVKEQGARTAAIGWHFPYCKLFGNFIDQCTSLNSGLVSFGSSSKDFLGKMLEHIHSLSPLYRRMYSVNNFLKFTDQVGSTLQNNNIDFLYIHWPLPHNPIIFDSQTNKISPFVFSNDNNLNLKLLDNTLGFHLGAIKENSWKDAIVILTADHGWGIRPAHEFDWIRRVPLIIRLPNNMKFEEINLPFNTLLLYELVPKLINKEITTSKEIQYFIQKNAGIFDEENKILKATDQIIN